MVRRMTKRMDGPAIDRRGFIAAATAAAGALACPARVFAQAAPDANTRRILDIARREVERAGDVLWRLEPQERPCSGHLIQSATLAP
jgi:hypothetical protein